ncbi:MAG: hypothetical protein GWN62_18075 [Aliifodinibius sp.]|nr:hypothetical protein [Fodinibius sp.]
MNNKRVVFWLLFAIFLAGCGMQNVEITQPTQTPFVITQLVTVIVEVTATPGPQDTETLQPTLTVVEESAEWVNSSEALNYVGSKTRVKVTSAQCSFQEGINGSPTFCNDQPFPDHNFTFLVWGQDWSHLDKKCVIVEGLVELYEGKPQIEVSDLDQVFSCED